ncbi:MAG: M23 family metallopeptidase, partial [bacterium]|nr:M23 family metallopeptidase [bacterium]
MKKKNYSIIIVTGATSSNKEFVLSSKLIKYSIIAFSSLLLVFGFVIFDYLTISFNKVKMEQLAEDNRAKAKTIDSLNKNFKSLERSLAQMEGYKDKIMVAAGLTSPYSLTEVGQGGGIDLGESGGGHTISSSINDMELSPDKQTNLPPTQKDMVDVTGIVAKRANQIQKDLRYVETHINEQKARLASTPALWPTRGYLTDSFGWRTHPFTGKRSFHNGLDIATQLGNKVIATADGYVLVREFSSFLGNVILIDHGFGFSTRYG